MLLFASLVVVVVVVVVVVLFCFVFGWFVVVVAVVVAVLVLVVFVLFVLFRRVGGGGLLAVCFVFGLFCFFNLKNNNLILSLLLTF